MKALQGHSHRQTKARKKGNQSVRDLERKRADKNNSAEEEDEHTAGAEVRRIDEDRESGRGDGESCTAAPVKEQMSLFSLSLFFYFSLPPSCCARRIHVRDEGRGGREEAGRAGRRNVQRIKTNECCSTASCSILWPKNPASAVAWMQG